MLDRQSSILHTTHGAPRADRRRGARRPLARWALAAALSAMLVPALAAPHAFTVKLAGGKVQGDDTLKVRQGEQVELNITSDRPVVLHVHGYEIEARITPPEPTRVAFKADVPGRFPVHEHREGAGNHRAVLFVEVHP